MLIMEFFTAKRTRTAGFFTVFVTRKEKVLNDQQKGDI
jgi:hypothetical protein